LHPDSHRQVGTEFPAVPEIRLHASVAEGAAGRTES
jgi:hypothetical protein